MVDAGRFLLEHVSFSAQCLVRQWIHYFRLFTELCGPSYLAATCLVLYVALERLKMRIFWEMTSRVISAFSACLLDSGYMFCFRLRGLLFTPFGGGDSTGAVPGHGGYMPVVVSDRCALVDYNSGMAGFAGSDAPRAVFFDSGRCKAGFVLAVFFLVVDRPTILATWCYGPDGHFHSVEVPQVQFGQVDVPVVFRDRSAQSVQRPSRSHRCCSWAWLYARCVQRWACWSRQYFALPGGSVVTVADRSSISLSFRRHGG